MANGKSYTNQEFVKVFLASKSKEEAAKKLGVSTWTIIRVAQKMRKAGVTLPTFGPGGSKREEIDVKALNKLIKETK